MYTLRQSFPLVSADSTAFPSPTPSTCDVPVRASRDRTPFQAARRGLLISTGLWLLVGLFTFAQTWWIGLADPTGAAFLTFLEWGPWIVFSPLVIVFANLVPITGRSWKWSVPLHLAASLGVAIAVNAVTMALSRSWMPAPTGVFLHLPPGDAPPPTEHARPRPFGPGGRATGDADRFMGDGPETIAGHAPASEAPWPRVGRGGHPSPLSGILLLNARLTLPIYWLIVVGVLAWRHHGIALEREGRALRAERELVHARLAALQSQLQPHFLFNSLNAISAFISQRPAAAEEMVVALSTLLRSVLRMSERTEIPLHEELDFARRYLAVHRIRFEDTLRVSWSIAPDTGTALVPTLLLQPLIENALDHGLRGAAGDLEISAHFRGQSLVLAVTNRSDLLATEPTPARDSTRLGLRNTRQRLETLFGSRYRLELHEVPGGARAEIELPLRARPA